jgi:2-polyprenyl-6-methoxyphenol hydroxylase-like FAD-dependent oxidoreductase
VHYPLRGGEQYNVVVTFHSRNKEEWGVTDGSKEEVQSYFQGIAARPRQLIDLPKTWKRWATADREPIDTWVHGRATLLGDAAHPTTQYMAQGACMALEDAVTLGEALRVNHNDWTKALALYQKSRVARTRASCCPAAKWAGCTTPRGWSGWCATACGKAERRALLRRHGMAVWLERRELSRPGLS